MLKIIIKRIAYILFGLAAGMGASYLLVVKGLKLPAGILGIFAFTYLLVLNKGDDDEPGYLIDPAYRYIPGNIYHAKDLDN